ncbi:helix-turn-helix domain-containing protein [Nocardia brasiliensis]|uniref:helix-turn-helix domain-containing protein n=1 Tax=Nocardia brasiliensis TaxID=37326 RepID=UPI002456B14E|nr:helix-turn-helix domain-containing protein [Nocardia brasiliensis]
MPERSASPPTRRVVDIVSLLTTANEPIGVAGIAERLGIARATATAILSELAAAGWVRRDPQRGYTIGPELAGLSSAALPPGVGEVLAALAARTGFGATFSRIEPDRLTVLDIRHGRTRVVPGIPVGHRIPLQFPAGASVMPWRPAAEQNAWIRTATGADRRTAAHCSPSSAPAASPSSVPAPTTRAWSTSSPTCSVPSEPNSCNRICAPAPCANWPNSPRVPSPNPNSTPPTPSPSATSPPPSSTPPAPPLTKSN